MRDFMEGNPEKKNLFNGVLTNRWPNKL